MISWREQKIARDAAVAEMARRDREWMDVFAKVHAS